MALFDSADLLAKCKLYARRPAVDAAMPDTSWYSFLTDAQPEVYRDIFSRRPEMGYGVPILMTTADGGLTYTFGNDAAGDPIRPIGVAQIFPNLRAIPSDPLYPGDDFTWEGSLIRIPGNRARQFTGGPYARLVLRPDVAIDGTHQPQLQPKSARLLLVWKALEAWASRPGSGASPVYYATKYNDSLDKVLMELATAYNQQAAQGAGLGGGAWWQSSDLGPHGLGF